MQLEQDTSSRNAPEPGNQASRSEGRDAEEPFMYVQMSVHGVTVLYLYCLVLQTFCILSNLVKNGQFDGKYENTLSLCVDLAC